MYGLISCLDELGVLVRLVVATSDGLVRWQLSIQNYSCSCSHFCRREAGGRFSIDAHRIRVMLGVEPMDADVLHKEADS